MTTKELLHNFAFDIQEGISDDKLGNRTQEVLKELEAMIRNEALDQVKEGVKKLHLKGIDEDRDMHDCTEEEKEHYLLGIDDTCYEVSTLIDNMKIK